VVPPLPGAEAEAQQVALMLKVSPLLGKEATKAAVLRKVAAADGLYFATHGVADGREPLSGGFLLLSAPDFAAGWWTAREIQACRLRAKLVVLSACQTGLGQVHDAGIIGLARAFQLAGVPRVVMSLWSVNDAATNELMQSFMRHLLGAEANTPAEALRLAMLETKRRQPDPAKWASFMVFGTSR
jgi:CHAT domain-containing protein